MSKSSGNFANRPASKQAAAPAVNTTASTPRVTHSSPPSHPGAMKAPSSKGKK